METTSLTIIFLTGLTTGGLTCLALQGGLLTSVIANQKEKNTYLPIFSFLTAKLLIHTILGFFLGLIGASISLSPIFRGWLQIAIGIYLFGVAGNLLNLHPIFRYFIITPPKFLAKLVKKSTQIRHSGLDPESIPLSNLFPSAILGLLTVFIPCAVTQAMEVVAIGTGNALYGAAIMFAFILGTTPTFLIFGFLLNKGSVSLKKYFPIVASLAMFIMSIFSINTGIAVMGSPYTLQNFWQVATTNSVLGDSIQTITITVTNSGYTPTNITLKKGVPTKLILITKDVQSCSRSFTIPGLNIQKLLPETGETIVEFTPQSEGPLAFSCSMGMYTGKFNIID